MDVNANWVPLVYVASLGGSYVLAVAASGFSQWHPGNLTSDYPMRPIVQLGAALSSSQHLLLIFLWFLATGSRAILTVGIFRFCICAGAQFITRRDSPLHGTLSLAEGVLTAIWMLVVLRSAPAKWRKRVSFLYTLNLILGFHFLAKHLTEGSHYVSFVATRCTNVVLSLLYEALSVKEFSFLSLALETQLDSKV